ncbi:MAG: EI24 domain-containing protein [Desulfobulbaceae bacterium]|nr:EI24 domain-containing protein [Desulfobulbaceae bacterium]
MQNPAAAVPSWVPLRTSFAFLFRHPRLLLWSLALVVLTGVLTWSGYLVSVGLTDQFTGTFFSSPPTVERFWHWPLLWGWTALKWVFLVLSRVVAFYLAFLVAYCLTTPGYVFLSTWAGNRYTEKAGEGEATFTLVGMLIDLREGAKIGALGLLVTVAALLANFIPVIGQVSVFVLYVFYSALMFVDFPSSRYRWSLGRKLRWVGEHRSQCFRLGLLPAVISMIPLLNVFLMALFLPLLTIHTTLNFLAIEGKKEIVPAP